MSLILGGSSGSAPTLFWQLSISESPIVWLRNCCHSAIWVGSYLVGEISSCGLLASLSPVRNHLLDDEGVDAKLPHQVGRRGDLHEENNVWNLSPEFHDSCTFLKLLALLLPLGDRLSGVMGGGFSSARSPGMKSSSRSVSLAPKMSMFVETLRWFLKLTSLISLRISVKSFMSRCWDIMDRINQSPKPRLDLKQILATSGLLTTPPKKLAGLVGETG